MSQTPENSSGLAGQLLLAMPGMTDPRFHRAVILICAHDANGAMGLVLNHPLPDMEFGVLLKQLNITPSDNAIIARPVLSGGPVETARGFVLHSAEFTQADTVRVSSDFAVTGTVDALRAVANGDGPQQMLFMLGYAGWGAGQLDKELQENTWLIADAKLTAIFDTPAAQQWDATVRALGIDPVMLSGSAGRA